MNGGMSLIDEAAKTAGRNMARQFDAILGALIKEHVGDFVLADLRGRLRAMSTIGKDEVTYYLDEQPLATFWPTESTMDGHTITFTQKYRIHKRALDSA